MKTEKKDDIELYKWFVQFRDFMMSNTKACSTLQKKKNNINFILDGTWDFYEKTVY